MLYKPKYCCQCGDGIERVDWKLWTSRRFCQLCETEFVVNEWIPKIYLGFSLIFVMFFFGNYLQNSGSSLKSGSPETLSYRPDNLYPANQRQMLAGNSENRLEQENSNATSNGQIQTNKNIGSPVENVEKRKGTEQLLGPQNDKKEIAYFCGAETKKGTPCSRRLKGGGRCWQHKGKEALLPDKELQISQ